jgi:hypothetical protein
LTDFFLNRRFLRSAQQHERIIFKKKQTVSVELGLKGQANEEHASDDDGGAVGKVEQVDEEGVQEAPSTVIVQKSRNSRKPLDPEQSKRKKLRLSQKSTKMRKTIFCTIPPTLTEKADLLWTTISVEQPPMLFSN